MPTGIRTHSTLILVLGTLTVCLMLGGGTRPGFLSDAILQVLCLPLFLYGIAANSIASHPPATRLVFAMCAAAVGWHLLQLVPLPPVLWTRLGDRSLAIASLNAAGIGLPWMPISLVPANTWTSLASLLPPMAILMGITLTTARERRIVSIAVLGIGAVSVFLGLLQFAQGPESGLRFFDVTNPDDAVGFFANRNHFGAFLYCVAMIALAWIAYFVRHTRLVSWHRDNDIKGIALVLAPVILLVITMAAMAMTRSRAALGLTVLGLAAAILIASREARSERQSITGAKVMAAAALFATLFASQFALVRFLDRFSGEPAANARMDFTVRTLETAGSYLPFGSGFGTFVQVFAPTERVEAIWSDGYVNRAHNDWAEILLEAGIGGAGLLVAACWWFAGRARRLWTLPHDPETDLDRRLMQAAALAMLLIALHSFVDYPLRTSAMAAMMALFAGFLLEPAPEPPPGGAGDVRQAAPPEKKRSGQSKSSREPAIASTAPPPGPSTSSAAARPTMAWPKEWVQQSPPSGPDSKRAPNDKADDQT